MNQNLEPIELEQEKDLDLNISGLRLPSTARIHITDPFSRNNVVAIRA